MNAPGNLVLPYGKGAVRVGGRGAAGNYASGGNVSYYNPTVPGNYAGSYSPEPGNVAGYNSPEPGNTGYNPPQPGPWNITTFFQYGTIDGQFTSAGYSGHWSGSGPHPPSDSQYREYGNGDWTLNEAEYDDVEVPGNAYSNPDTPGTAYYNPTEPGYAYYNSPTPGNANYNPYVPGNPGPTNSVGGVVFPGGAADSLAPVVAPAPSTLRYTASPIPITVGSGGYVTITTL
jgi:hypothetical protein